MTIVTRARLDAGGRAPIIGARLDPRPASKVVLAVTVVAGHAQRPSLGVDDNDRVSAVGLAGTAVVFDGLAGAMDTVT